MTCVLPLFFTTLRLRKLGYTYYFIRFVTSSVDEILLGSLEVSDYYVTMLESF